MEMWTVSLIREEKPEWGPDCTIRGPNDIASIMASLCADSPVEKLYVFSLNTAHCVVGVSLASQGIVDATLIHPREVFRSAILCNAAGIIVAHNHPTGNVTMSREDRTCAEGLVAAGETLGIPCLDFLVTNHKGDFSSYARGDC